jgi:RHS repeat-associated protein
VSNRLTGTTGQLQRTYLHDATGNVLSDGSATFTYNFANRMVSASKSGLTTNYTYNALGQRVRKVHNGVVTYYLYDEGSRLLGQYDGSNSLIEEIIWLGDTPVATLRPSGTGGVAVYYIHTDHLNTPRRITRPSDNKIIWRWNSDPYGAALADNDPDGDGATFEFQMRFPGQVWDSETGLNYNYFRDFDASIGRYAQSDPIGLRGGPSTFAYANSSPTMFADPLGLLALHRVDTWEDVEDIGGERRGGYTQAFLRRPDFACGCSESGGCWTLNECEGTVRIKVQIRRAWHIFGDEDQFYREKEQEHLDDFTAGWAQIYEAGKAAEDKARGMKFFSQQDCEVYAEWTVLAALVRALNSVAMASGNKYDRGRHTWHGHYRFTGW